MSEILLARHGETTWHAENRYAGSSDIGLTDRGREQADALGRWAARRPITAVYSSDLTRAVETAAPAARALGVPLHRDARIREVDFGRGEGLTATEMKRVFPDALEEFYRRPGHSPLPDGEAGTDAIDRAWPALRAVAHAHENSSVLVVMHSTLLRLILCAALGIPIDRYRRVFPSIGNVTVTTLSMSSAQPALRSFNVPIE